MKRVMLFVTLVIVVLYFSLTIGSNRKVQAQGLSLVWPVSNHQVTQLYSSGHPAIDMIDPQNRINPPIFAAADGVVVHVGYRSNDPQGGYEITIHHDTVAGGKYYTWYAHLAHNSNTVSVGQRVNKGQQIATMGNTSSIQNLPIHLHFVLNTNAQYILQGTIDPLPYLNGNPPANPLPVISQEGRIIMNDLSPPVGGTVRFEVTLKNNSNFPAEFREIFLRINHVATGVERKVDVWHGQQGILVIPANSTWTFRVFSPPIDMLGAWRLHNIEMLHHPTGTWLQGIRNNDYFFAGLTNVARGKTVHVHSVRAGSGNNPQHLVDGNHATRYESAWYDDQIVEIDLGATHKIGYIVMYWEAAYAQKFRVHVNSNDCGSNKHACTWSRVYATGVGENRTYLLTFPQQNVRWVKIWLEKRATPWGFSLWEVTAY